MSGTRTQTVPSIAAAVALLALPSYARANDTVETWDVGATDVDFYLGYDGIGAPRDERATSADLMLGYGLVPNLSAYLGATIEADMDLAAEPTVYLGVFGTLVDTDHVDFDLFLDVSAGGPGLSSAEIAPSFELNLDASPDLATWGGYLRAGLVAYGRAEDENPEAGSVGVALDLNPGVYVTVADGHQVLLEYDMRLHANPEEDEEAVSVGGVALGYNVTLSDALELITQAHVSIPTGGEGAAGGVVVGFIATLPAAGGGS